MIFLFLITYLIFPSFICVAISRRRCFRVIFEREKRDGIYDEEPEMKWKGIGGGGRMIYLLHFPGKKKSFLATIEILLVLIHLYWFL